MPTFTYQAKQGPSNVIEGTIEAVNQDEAVTKLMRDGLVPVSVVRIPAGDVPGNGIGRWRRVRVSSRDRRMFTRQLTSLLRAKVELVPAMSVLRAQSPSRAVRMLLEDLERHMRDGNPLSEALARHPRVFSPLFLSAIRAGEAAGKLDDILIKLVEFDEQQEQLESRFRGAVAYPALLLVVGIASLGFFIWFVVPRMAGLFTQLGAALPWPTRALMELSGLLARDWPWILGGGVVGGLLIQRLRRMPLVINAMERLLRHMAFANEILEARQVGRFTRTLQMLLHSGLPVFQAMEVARPTLGSALMEHRMRAAQELVKQGESISMSLETARCFPPLVTRMVAVGESAGTLVDVLGEMATYYERLLDERLRIATALLEPLMILVMGILVGFCVLAMVLPVFQMTQIVR